MSMPFEDALKDLMGEYEKARNDLAKVQESMAKGSGKARSKNRMLSVTIDGHGDVTELKFHTQAWRSMAPGELSKVIVETIKEARDAAQKQMWSALGEFLPGVDIAELAAGNVASGVPETLEIPAVIKDFLTSLDQSEEAKKD